MSVAALSTDDLVSKAVELVMKTIRERGLRENGVDAVSQTATLPLLMGAGVSVSAGVPLSAALLRDLTIHCPGFAKSSSKSYDEVLRTVHRQWNEELDAEARQYFSKEKFRQLLHRCGIPRIADNVLPNIENLLIHHLLNAEIVGPVVSLNVDPLLKSAQDLADTQASQCRFIQNISEFSGSGAVPINTIFQPHGTIEEPFSLRFSQDELVDGSYGLLSSITNGIGRPTGILILGVNLADKVTQRLIRALADKERASNLDVILPLFDKVANQEAISGLVRNGLGEIRNVRLSYCLGVDAEEFLRRFYEALLRRFKEEQSEGSLDFFVPTFADVEFRHFVYSGIGAEGWRDHMGVRCMPPIDQLIRTEIFLYCISARGPFTIGSLVDWLMQRPYLRGRFDNLVAETRDALIQLNEGRVIAPYEDLSKSVFSRRIDALSKGPIALLTRGELFEGGAGALANQLVKMLGVEAPPKSKRERLEQLIQNAELDRSADYHVAHGVPLAVRYTGVRLIHDHADLDAQALRRLKRKFSDWVDEGSSVTCKIMTEYGDHLFNLDVLSTYAGRENELTETEVLGACRDWLHGIFRVGSDHPARLTILVARHDREWGIKRSPRSALASLVDRALSILGKRPRIEVFHCPWDRHDDHMFLVSGFRVTDGSEVSEAVVFPRIHGESRYCAFETSSLDAIKELEMIFNQVLDKYATASPLATDPGPVLAITVIDMSSSTDSQRAISHSDKVLVGVRSVESNRQHREIASVPTKRLPLQHLWDIVGGNVSTIGDEGEVLSGHALIRSGRKMGATPLINEINNLMALKLGVADALEREELVYEAVPVILRSGRSPILSDDDVPEPLLMVNCLVLVRKGANLFPSKTGSYSRLGWSTVSEFLKAVPRNGATKGELRLDDGSSAPYMCGGLCVCTSSVLIQAMQPVVTH